MALDLGMLGVDDLNAQVAAGDIDTVIVGFTDHYGRLHGKRFDASLLGIRSCRIRNPRL